MKLINGLIICNILVLSLALNCQSKMVLIKGGTYTPLYGSDSLKVSVQDFKMDVYPVSNKLFLEFIKKNLNGNGQTLKSSLLIKITSLIGNQIWN